ncbi:MAG: aspartate/glutamate racemase family protein [Patescibacteria group bacterium]
MIGIFDSGSGGLTVLKEIKKLIPKADIVYFGDLKNAPYGNRTPEEIGALTVLGFQKLINHGATQIVSACNSASANIVLPLLDSFKIKPNNIIEMVGPTVKAFKSSFDRFDKLTTNMLRATNKVQRILLVATEATIRSGIYQNGFQSLHMDIQTLALPHLAGAIENKTSHPALLAMIGDALEKYNGTYDTLILGCTHFPLVIDLFARNIPKGVTIFDPAEVVAREAQNLFLLPNSREWANKEKGSIRFLISKDSDFFREKVAEFFGDGNYKIEVIK